MSSKRVRPYKAVGSHNTYVFWKEPNVQNRVRTGKAEAEALGELVDDSTLWSTVHEGSRCSGGWRTCLWIERSWRHIRGILVFKVKMPKAFTEAELGRINNSSRWKRTCRQFQTGVLIKLKSSHYRSWFLTNQVVLGVGAATALGIGRIFLQKQGSYNLRKS